MSTYIQTLKKGNDTILPRTVASAITTNNGDTLQGRLEYGLYFDGNMPSRTENIVTWEQLAGFFVTKTFTFQIPQNTSWTLISGSDIVEADIIVEGLMANDKAILDTARGKGNTSLPLSKELLEQDEELFSQIVGGSINQDGVLHLLSKEPINSLWLQIMAVRL